MNLSSFVGVKSGFLLVPVGRQLANKQLSASTISRCKTKLLQVETWPDHMKDKELAQDIEALKGFKLQILSSCLHQQKAYL